jgi:Phage portal protein
VPLPLTLSPFRTAALALSVPATQILSPWADDSFLERVVVPDIWPGAEPLPMTRGEAMAVPAVARSRHLICATIARLPLQVLDADDALVDPQPGWAYRTDGQLGDLATERADDDAEAQRLRLLQVLAPGQSPFHRMLATADDLLFYGWSLWLVTQRDPEDGRPTRMLRMPYGTWDVNASNELTDQDGQPLAPLTPVLFQGMSEGLLANGARTIRTAGDLESTGASVARRPFRLELHQTTDIALEPGERSAIVAETRRALADNEGILFTNAALETKTHDLKSDALLVAGRNAAALDIARHANIPGAMIDATTEGASLEYQTTETRGQQWLDYGLTAFLDPITARLSMDDVVARGRRTVFDTSTLTTRPLSPTGPEIED